MEQDDRKKHLIKQLDKSKNVVADKVLFTAINEFFQGMTKEDIIDWAILVQSLFMNIQVIKGTSFKGCSISKKQYIRDKIHLSELQDKIINETTKVMT